ncbi:acyl CoA binding family protein [Colletotrichum higginsianum]|uniref:Acyl CoA binding family protein n=1 Tax=Colletotrichum higginsianum (strain IMI 349063) TaxID=759273 RepID=H1VZV7_COLHI|nr:acyl CoA binding family protein [Colletotrichum higginsianum]
MSEDDAAERNSVGRIVYNEEEEGDALARSSNWSRSVERALEKLSAEVAALREQITTGREWKSKKSRSFPAWIRWFTWVVLKHLAIDAVLLAFILLWMRKRKDRRLEDLVRAGVKLMREYVYGLRSYRCRSLRRTGTTHLGKAISVTCPQGGRKARATYTPIQAWFTLGEHARIVPLT